MQDWLIHGCQRSGAPPYIRSHLTAGGAEGLLGKLNKSRAQLSRRPRRQSYDLTVSAAAMGWERERGQTPLHHSGKPMQMLAPNWWQANPVIGRSSQSFITLFPRQGVGSIVLIGKTCQILPRLHTSDASGSQNEATTSILDLVLQFCPVTGRAVSYALPY